MFIISLTYHQPIETVEAHLEEHIAWLKKYYAQGAFVASGRKVPRTGGVIFAKTMERSVLESILSEDPFNAVANYDIIEFAPSMTSKELDGLKTI
ncbi:YciI family protein [Brenneria izadpanahii]|uniref:YciI family protein n=1 Tax=Brenneria izadpanahii TaxID=2722756 RepID=A0ABX7UW35_9GAMM|nr:YciI family protein [Brenneria izadpanahii]QTF08390.1 YciI family protein [Brenneria izadpanahii]